MSIWVVHCKIHQYDIYVGRGRGSKWGNPYKIGIDGTREEVIQKHKLWLLKQPALLSCLDELKGKILGCWCAPQACHGDLLALLANDLQQREAFLKVTGGEE